MLLNEFFQRRLNEGGNLAIGQDQADQINLQVTKRTYIVPILNDLLLTINNTFAKRYQTPLWSPELLQKQTFLSGSSLHFFNVKGIPDEEFVAKKPKVGDIDTMVAKDLEANLDEFLTSNQGKMFGTAKLIGHQRGNEQFSSLFELQDPPIKVQIDLEFVAQQQGEPTDWARFSHSSSWEDIKEGVKGVFHKFLIQSFSVLSQKEFLLRKKVGRGKAAAEQDIPTTDNLVSFAVSSKEGGGLRAKYEPILDDNGLPLEVNGLPVMRALPAEGYKQDISEIFGTLFGDRISPDQLKAMDKQFWSFTGLLGVMNSILKPEEKQAVANAFLEKLFSKGAQGLYKNDAERDLAEKGAAVNLLFNTLKVPQPSNLPQMQADYKANYRVTSESMLSEAGEVVQSKRKGIVHLEKMKDGDFLDLLDELHDNGQFKLQNIPMTVKVDGFGGRIGKSEDGRPYFETSRSGPKFGKGQFADYHKQRGTTDIEVIQRAEIFDQLQDQIMDAIGRIDQELGPDFLMDTKVHVEMLYAPFSIEQEDGRLKYVGIAYDKLPEGVTLAMVPLFAEVGSTGENHPNSKEIVAALNELGQVGAEMFIDNGLVQKDSLDVTAIVPPMENIEAFRSMLASKDKGINDRKSQVKAALDPIKQAVADAIINDPNIVGKDVLGQDYEGIILNTRNGPVKITSPEQKKVMADKQAAIKSKLPPKPGEGGRSGKTAVVTIGSFVGHKGHQQLVDMVLNKAAQLGGDPYVYISSAVGPDDPIPPEEKLKTWQMLYPDQADIFQLIQAGGTPAKKIEKELVTASNPPPYDHIVVMVGDDRYEGFKKWMEHLSKRMKNPQYPGFEHVTFDVIKTERDAAKGGTGISFTMLRNVLKDANATPADQLNLWMQGFDGEALGQEWVQHLMDLARAGMNAPKPKKATFQTTPAPKKEPVMAQQPAPAQEPQPEQPLAENLKRQMAMLNAQIVWQKELMEDATGLDRAKRTQLINFIAKAKGWGVSDLELAKDSELIYMYKKIKAGEDIQETKRMSAAAKLSKAWDREQQKSAASRKRGEEVMAQAKKDTEKKQLGEFAKNPEFDDNGGDDETPGSWDDFIKAFDPEIRKMGFGMDKRSSHDGRIYANAEAQKGVMVRQHPEKDNVYYKLFRFFNQGEDEVGLADLSQNGAASVLVKVEDFLADQQGVAEDISRRGFLKGIGGAAAMGAASKADAIAGAFPSPSTRQKWANDAAASNAAEARRQAELQRQANAARAAKLAHNTQDVERLNKVNYHGKDAPKPTNATWDGDSDFMDLDGTQYTMASRMPISGNEPRDMKLISTSEGHQVYIWTRYRMKGDGGHYFYPADAVKEAMLPKSAFSGSDKHKLGRAGQAMAKDKAPLRGKLVGETDKKKGADGKACWKGYKYAGTKNGKDKCVPVGEDIENLMAGFIKLLESKK